MGISGRSFAQSAWVLMVAFLACSSKTCSLKYCTPSSCGNIPNISYPFRLKHDPETCGKAGFTLLCENNIIVLDLPSLKYHVQAINYSSQTIRVVDPGFQENNCSSVPVNPPTKYDPFLGSSPYNVYYSSKNTVTERIYFLKCSERVNMRKLYSAPGCAAHPEYPPSILACGSRTLVGRLEDVSRRVRGRKGRESVCIHLQCSLHNDFSGLAPNTTADDGPSLPDSGFGFPPTQRQQPF